MLELLRKAGICTAHLSAKIAGGANMFGHSGPLQIGEANGRAVCEVLAGVGIRVAAQDIGGTQGRRVTLDCATGDMWIEVAGSGPRTL
jgi:chemotaxis protein CheD